MNTRRCSTTATQAEKLSCLDPLRRWLQRKMSRAETIRQGNTEAREQRRASEFPSFAPLYFLAFSTFKFPPSLSLLSPSLPSYSLPPSLRPSIHPALPPSVPPSLSLPLSLPLPLPPTYLFLSVSYVYAVAIFPPLFCPRPD